MVNRTIISKDEKFRTNTAPSPEEVKEYTEYIRIRTVRMLTNLIDYSHMRREWIEEDMGYSKTYFAKLLAGKIELRVEHVTSICRLLEFPVAMFWSIVYEDETINLESYNNGLVRRMRALLIYVHSKEPNKLAAALGHVEPDREEMKFKPYSFAESRKE